jgi:Secretion system C-terminal sorting domain
LPTERKSALVKIYDLQGKLVQSENVTSGYGILSLNAKYFAAGIYVFELELNGQKVATEKFQIVQ